MELVKANTTAPTPTMVKPAADAFARLRKKVLDAAGFDFLARCGDMFRPADFRSKKDGVANRSWHKTGRAFDYDQTSPYLLLVSEPSGGKQYFRTYLRCPDQSGKHGEKKSIRDYRGGTWNLYIVDFTKLAEAEGFKRIPAWNGWQSKYNRREFWHYQYKTDGLTWDAAMLDLRGKSRPKTDTVLGKNDRGDEVRAVQTKLSELGLLDAPQIDGIYGDRTFRAVCQFQANNKLDVDGLVGPATRKTLGL